MPPYWESTINSLYIIRVNVRNVHTERSESRQELIIIIMNSWPYCTMLSLVVSCTVSTGMTCKEVFFFLYMLKFKRQPSPSLVLLYSPWHIVYYCVLALSLALYVVQVHNCCMWHIDLLGFVAIPGQNMTSLAPSYGSSWPQSFAA